MFILSIILIDLVGFKVIKKGGGQKSDFEKMISSTQPGKDD